MILTATGRLAKCPMTNILPRSRSPRPVRCRTLPDGDQTRPISEVVVEFNEPILTASFTKEDVTIIGPTGEVPVGVDPIHVDDSHYRVVFPEQSADGEYHVTSARR